MSTSRKATAEITSILVRKVGWKTATELVNELKAVKANSSVVESIQAISQLLHDDVVVFKSIKE